MTSAHIAVAQPKMLNSTTSAKLDCRKNNPELKRVNQLIRDLLYPA